MQPGGPISLLNNKQMSNMLGVEYQPAVDFSLKMCCVCWPIDRCQNHKRNVCHLGNFGKWFLQPAFLSSPTLITTNDEDCNSLKNKFL